MGEMNKSKSFLYSKTLLENFNSNSYVLIPEGHMNMKTGRKFGGGKI